MKPDLRVAMRLADIADQISMRSFRSPALDLDRKLDGSPVTRVDRDVELAIRAELDRARPTDGVLGEEFGASRPNARRRWIVDPIDGTQKYIRGVPLFATLLALEEEGAIAVAVVSAPALGHRWWAESGGGAFIDGRRLTVSSVDRLCDASVSGAGPDGWLESGRFDRLEDLTGRSATTTGFGDFWPHVLVAEGAADAALDPLTAAWDLAPLALIVREAGGRFTDFAGRDTFDGGSGLSSNGLIHAELLDLLASPDP
jgi:histidinol-phosphatase